MNLYLDIETTPSVNPKIMQTIADGIEPPGNYKKADTIAAWNAETRPGLIKDAIAKTALDGAYGRICCIGFAFDDHDPNGLNGNDERGLLMRFIGEIEDARSAKHYLTPTLIGHNIINFDIRFIWQRAMVLGVRMPNWFPRDPKPYDRDVVDTMLSFAGYRGMVSLSKLCDAFGIDNTDDIDGSMIGELWANGEYEKVASHCRSDVEKVRQVHKKMLIAYGE